MKSWNDIAEAVRRQPRPEPVDSSEFWKAFRLRARDEPREINTRQPVPRLLPPSVLPGAWALAAALLVLLVAAMAYRLLQTGGPAPALSSAPQLSLVQALDVPAHHESVIILQDEEHHGTIIWIDVSNGMGDKQSG